MSRNVKYSDGTMVDGEGKGTILDGTPGVDAYYTGYHFTKAVCENCGTINSNMGKSDYGYGKNVYWLYDCAAEFTEALPETVTYEYTDSRYHTKTTTGGSYCCFCYGTNHERSSALERHTLETDILPQPPMAGLPLWSIVPCASTAGMNMSLPRPSSRTTTAWWTASPIR